jgi:Multiubiquitin
MPYRFKVDGKTHELASPTITGAQLIGLARQHARDHCAGW